MLNPLLFARWKTTHPQIQSFVFLLIYFSLIILHTLLPCIKVFFHHSQFSISLILFQDHNSVITSYQFSAISLRVYFNIYLNYALILYYVRLLNFLILPLLIRMTILYQLIKSLTSYHTCFAGALLYF